MPKRYNDRRTVIRGTRNAKKETNKEPFLTVRLKDLESAAKCLSGTGFKVWLYIASNAENYRFDFSPQDCANHYGIDRQTASRKFEELENCGFLNREINDKGDEYWIFTEETTIREEEKRGLINEDGKLVYYTYLEMIDKFGEQKTKKLWSIAVPYV